ncbi:SusC/RagA family TonB-linked outer membrane protein [Arcicella sp. LKC2W]|uniref:SusC/RagA family TonB-linked outer membrane protein n=1 Tax=Arcicella sp. LKC2W TaxID=2984198 RepID=UPI002B1F98A7|nr:SusC/RagA family TonB-linked outer membrane protein [Arcicella sp. LKC2W]MEA5459495.1 SusC/RagA family TonB-linked outer membrane protein [Arcicella sp. LKC2W]
MKSFILILFLSYLSITTYGQNRKITGRITEAENSSTIIGVSVLLKGTNTGSTSDKDGSFSLNVPNSGGILVISFVGMESQEIPITSQTNYLVKLKPDTKQLMEITVTALGFEQNKDVQGATSSKVTGLAIARTGEAGVINGLAGRAAGVQISRSSGDPGAGSYIQIRGQSTITGDNQPLVIIDGIPMSNSSIGENAGGVRQQSRLNDLNPNDIANVEILKGAAAAALWGSRAANGVMVITTKKGRNSTKPEISFSSTVSFDKVNVLHPLQTKFGQGINGVFSPTSSTSWGDKIENRSGGADEYNTTGQYFQALDGTKYYPITKKNSKEIFNDQRLDQVFRTGIFVDNNLSISGGNDQSTYYISFGDLNQKGIIRGQSDYRRTTFRLNADRKFGDIFSVSTKTSYIKSVSNRIQTGSNVNGLYLGMVRTPADFDDTDYQGYYYSSPSAAPAFRQRSYRRYLGNDNPIYDSPLWVINELKNPTVVNRFLTATELNFKPTKWFELKARGGVDSYTDERQSYFPVGSAGSAFTGSYQEEVIKETELNFDLIARVTKDISPSISGTYIAGWNVNNRDYLNLGYSMVNFLIPNGPKDASNATAANRTPFDTEQRIRTTRVYGTTNFGFKDQIFLNLGIAAESGSPFGEKTNRTFLYPSADLAWQFSKLSTFKDSKALSFGKIRGSYGIVGVQPQPYRTTTDFVTAEFTGGWGGTTSGVAYGNGAFVQSAQQGDAFLRPERKTEWEIGTDLRFLSDKLTLGFTYYQNKIKDLLLEVAASPSTGFTSRYTNAGTMSNKGWEGEISADVFRQDGLDIQLVGNISQNINRVEDLAGTDQIVLGGFSTLTSSVAKVGYSLSALYGGTYLRKTDGSLNLNSNGFPQLAPTYGVIGDPNPKYRAGFGTNISYKNFTLNVLFETFQGSTFAPNTQAVLYNFGTHADVGNEVLIPSGGLKNYDGKVFEAGQTVRGNIKDFGAGPVLLDQAWYTTLGQGFSALQEQFMVDGSWTRLREMTLAYNWKSPWLKDKLRLSSINFSATGRNLFLFTDVVGIDPETSLNGTGNGRGQDYFNNPGSKSLVFSVRINY